ncbi:MAG: glycosyltransferase family 4 protein, partial [Neisseria sp.]|nr:glycosyltransferase family 4 protein [Neisseria sp.]
APTYPKISKLFKYLGVYIIANCQHEQDKLIRHGFPRECIAYTYNALASADGSAAKSAREHIQLGTLSRLDKIRAVHRTLPMLKTLREQGLNVFLHIAGTGEELPNLQQQAHDLGIDKYVEFLGAVRDLPDFFRKTDILINTLDCQGDMGAGVGNNILEAGLFQTAVVSYDVAGIREMVVDGETGRCIALYDDANFVAAIAELARNPKLRTQYGSALRERVLRLCNDDEIYRTTLSAYALAKQK